MRGYAVLRAALPRLARPSKSQQSLMTGTELKQLRKSLRLSLSTASRQVEVTPRTWARWEAAEKVPPGVVKLFRIENGLKKPGTK